MMTGTLIASLVGWMVAMAYAVVAFIFLTAGGDEFPDFDDIDDEDW